MAEQNSLAQTVSELVESPGGQILVDVKEFLISRIKYIVGIFLLGVVIGFPLTKAVISWLIDPSRLPWRWGSPVRAESLASKDGLHRPGRNRHWRASRKPLE